MAANNVPLQPGAGWDEAQCKAALARLEELHDDVTLLRLSLPRVMEVLTSRPFNGAAMFNTYKKSVVDSQEGINSLRTQWHSQEVQSIFEHTTQSLNKDEDLTPSAKIEKWGWVENQMKEKEATRMKSDGVQKPEDIFIKLTNEDVTRGIEEFQKGYPNIKILMKDDKQDLLFKFVAGSRHLQFHVVIERETNGRHKLNAECLGNVEPFLAITRCVQSRPQTNDFKYLLNMIAAYKTVKATSCAKCNSMIDKFALTPTARRCKRDTGANDTSEIVWEAFHEGCLE